MRAKRKKMGIGVPWMVELSTAVQTYLNLLVEGPRIAISPVPPGFLMAVCSTLHIPTDVARIGCMEMKLIVHVYHIVSMTTTNK